MKPFMALYGKSQKRLVRGASRSSNINDLAEHDISRL